MHSCEASFHVPIKNVEPRRSHDSIDIKFQWILQVMVDAKQYINRRGLNRWVIHIRKIVKYMYMKHAYICCILQDLKLK
jgi:hypothetical protein